jgi:hypothetical protein
MGSVSSKTFQKYESSIDEPEASLQILINNAKTAVIQARVFIYAEIRSDKIKIYALGTLTLVFFWFLVTFYIFRLNIQTA